MDIDLKEYEPHAFIGVAFTDKVIFNSLEHDVDFLNTGLSIIQHVKRDKNKYISKIIESQSYGSIKYIFDDKIILGEYIDSKNENRESFSELIQLLQSDNYYRYFYILDLNTNKLVVKIPEIQGIIAIDYTNEKDVRDIINTIKKR